MDQRIIKELIQRHGFTYSEIRYYKEHIKGMLLYKRLELKYAARDLKEELTKMYK